MSEELTQHDLDEALVVNMLGEMIRKAGFVRKVDHRAKLKALIAKGWTDLYAQAFGRDFVDVLAPHHIEALEWHWNSRLAFLNKEHPEYLAYFPIWARGAMKSTVAEHIVVIDALLSVAFGSPGYALYVSRNKDKVQEHIANIEALLGSPKVRMLAPSLSNPKRTEITNQQRRWTSSFLKTEADYSVQGGTLDSGLAGSRVGETRPTMIIPDDIDGREDSPVIAESRFRQLTTEVLPMRQENTLVFFAQNLISRYSVMYRIQTGQARVLANRKPSEPIPAVRDLKTEQRTINGIVKDIFVSGEATWKAWSVQRIQDEIDTEGLASFLREAQHEVEMDRSGVILYNYDDKTHVISESEFAAIYGSLDIWLHWRKKPGNDWARTKTDKHANVAAWLTISDSNTPLPNVTFLMHPMSFPANSAPEDVAERVIGCLSPYAYGEVTWERLRKDVVRRLNADQHTKTVADKIAYEHGELSRIIPTYTRPLLQRCNVQSGSMSHEMSDVRQIYRNVYAMGMLGINPKKHGGIELINRAMRVDYEQPHAFRPDEMGYTAFYLVVPDDKTQQYREVDNSPVYKPRPFPLAVQTNDMADSDLWRFQISNWRFREPVLSASGELVDDPLKLWDDGPNLLQMLFVSAPLQGTSLTERQRIDLLIPQSTKDMVAQAVTGGDKLTAALTKEFDESIARMQLGLEDEMLGDVSEWEIV